MICLIGLNLGPLPIEHMSLIVLEFCVLYFGEFIYTLNIARTFFICPHKVKLIFKFELHLSFVAI